MLRRLQIELDELNGRYVSRYRYAVAWANDIWHNILIMLRYYDVRNFVRNLPHFIKQAWYYRDFDYSYALECFISNLERLGDGLARCNNALLSKRNSRRCKFAAYLLRRAYEDNFIFEDKSYTRWVANNKVYFDEIKDGEHKGMYQMKYKREYSEDYSRKMQDIINKRHVSLQKSRKKEAWEYLHKYIESFWD